MAFYKLYTPYMELINGANNYQGIDLTALDNVLENIKGYIEVVLEGESLKTIVLRFNAKTFKNNYKLSDILKMNLDIYAIKVGKIRKNKMELEKEITLTKEQITADDILNTKKEKKDFFEVYDVVLAGVADE